MSEDQQPDEGPLEDAVRAFREMAVCERPADAEVLARLGIRPGEAPQGPGVPTGSKRRHLLYFALPSAAAAVLLLGGLAVFLRNSPPTAGPVQVAVTGPAGGGRDVAVPPPPQGRRLLREGLGSFEKGVADARVIVVATAVGASPAPLKRPGDLPETLLHFRVKRVLKGEWGRKEVTTRTPTAADEFLGKDWVILLSADYLAGKHQYASHANVKLEPVVKAALSRDKR